MLKLFIIPLVNWRNKPIVRTTISSRFFVNWMNSFSVRMSEMIFRDLILFMSCAKFAQLGIFVDWKKTGTNAYCNWFRLVPRYEKISDISSLDFPIRGWKVFMFCRCLHISASSFLPCESNLRSKTIEIPFLIPIFDLWLKTFEMCSLGWNLSEKFSSMSNKSVITFVISLILMTFCTVS